MFHTSNKKDALSLFWSLWGISPLSIWNLHMHKNYVTSENLEKEIIKNNPGY